MNFIKEWGMIAGLAGLALGAFLVLFREIIRLKIFSKLTKKQSYFILIIFMILVWSISIFSIVQYSSEEIRDSDQVTVLVHEVKGKDRLILTNRGRVKLLYGDANVVETINDKGEATFKQIPAEFFIPHASVEILFFDPEGEPYRAVKPDSLYQLSQSKYIALAVKLHGLGELTGIVKDFKTGDPISGVRISITGAATFSNQYGEYSLSIPTGVQRKFQTVRALKEGYKSFEYKNVPLQTGDEFPILMKRQ